MWLLLSQIKSKVSQMISLEEMAYVSAVARLWAMDLRIGFA
jgi:hypothetical protein